MVTPTAAPPVIDAVCRHCYNRKSLHIARYASCPEPGMGGYCFSPIPDHADEPQQDSEA